MSFQQSVIFPILKKGDPNQADNYRGISFLNSALKILIGVMANRFKSWTSQNRCLSEFQAGFRENYSTIDQIFILNTTAQTFIREKRKLYAFFVDLKAAFDTVDRSALFYKLYNIGLSRKFGNLIEKLYEQTTSAVWDGSQLSNFFETVTGVKQGCNLSPQAFIMFIDDISDYLCGGVRIGGILIKVLMYADDLVLLADTPERLQRMINQLKKYCDEWRLNVNINKSKTMVFRKGGGCYARNEKWFFDGQELETVKSYKYLGINICYMNMEQHFQEKLSSSKSAISAAWKNCLEDKHISMRIKYQLFQAVSKSIMLYGAQVWGYKSYDTVEKLLRIFLKRIFKLPQSSPNHMLFVETGISPLFIETLRLHFNFIAKTMVLDGERLTKRIASYVIEKRILFYEHWKALAEFAGQTLRITMDNIHQWKEEFDSLIEAVDEKIRAESIEKALTSTHREIYASLNHNLCENNYFNEKYSTDTISTVFKARGEIMDLNFIPHREDLQIFCTICNMRERENIYHFLGRCPVSLKGVQDSFFWETRTGGTRNENDFKWR